MTEAHNYHALVLAFRSQYRLLEREVHKAFDDGFDTIMLERLHDRINTLADLINQVLLTRAYSTHLVILYIPYSITQSSLRKKDKHSLSVYQ